MFLPDGHRIDSSDDWSQQSREQWETEKVALGIRLGQVRCSVSCVENGQLRDLFPKIPSLVTFTSERTYYGQEAIKHSITNISNSVYQFLGLLGRRFEDKAVQQFARHCTYRVVQIDRTQHPQIPRYPLIDEDIGVPIQCTASSFRIYTIIDIVSQFLQFIIREAQQRLGCRVHHVAISVPNTFGQLQRVALMQAAKEANIEPLRLVTSCMAASVCLRFHQIRAAQEGATSEPPDDDHKEEVLHSVEDGKEAVDYNNSPYTAYRGHSELGKNGYYHEDGIHDAHRSLHHGHSNGHHYGHHHHDHHHAEQQRARRKRKKRGSGTRSRCYLVADLSNIGCSLSIVECKQKRHSDLVKVRFCSGSTSDGLWRMINAFSLFVVRSFVDGYKGYYRPHRLDADHQPQTDAFDRDGLYGPDGHHGFSRSEHDHHRERDRRAKASRSRRRKRSRDRGRTRKRRAFYDSISRYDYGHDVCVYDELQRIESIETTESDPEELDRGRSPPGDALNGVHGVHRVRGMNGNVGGSRSSVDVYSLDNEALKCRFRAQMLCDTIIEHLHDQYCNEEVQIHYEKFYRSFSLQLILTAQKLQQIALDPFLFSLTHCLDKILQQNGDELRIDECLLVGDGGNIPAVESLFGEYFELNAEAAMHSECVVARGCAVAAAIDVELVPSPICLDLLPHSIRMEDATNNGTDTNCVVIAAQNPCPCKKTVKRYTYRKEQTTYSMRFYEGESNNNRLCELIGRFEIRNIKRRKSTTQIVIAVHVDRNGIIMVSAEDVSASPPVPLTVVKLSH